MGVQKSNLQRGIASILLAVLVSGLGYTLQQGWWGDGLIRSSYDSLHRLSNPPALTNCPVVIIYLDLPSYLQLALDPGQPWPRALHAKLINRLDADGARAVVFDIVFSGPGPDAAGNEALAKSLRKNGRVVLAAEYNNDASHFGGDLQPRTRTQSIVLPHDALARNAAATGLAVQVIDDDYGVRRYVAGFKSDQSSTLTWATATWLHLPVSSAAGAMETANQHWLRYYGPPLTLPHVSYSEALAPADIPGGFFRDKIVFIGARPWVESIRERKDEFHSPYRSWANKETFIPGVEVHATEMLNLIRGDGLRKLGPRMDFALVVLVAIVFGGGLVWLRPIPATLGAALGAGLALVAALVGFSRGLWFPWVINASAQIPAALGGSVLFYSIEWYRARRIFEAVKRVADAKIREQAALIDKANDAILVQNLEGNFIYANPSGERLYGWKLPDLQQDGVVTELFSPDSATAARARDSALAQGEWNGELRMQTRAGKILTVANRWTLIRDEDGKPKTLLLIQTDITEKKELEAQFLRTQRMNTIGTLAGGMAHDINNALAPILMGAQLLRRKTSDEESKRLLTMMETQTHRSADMVQQVLLFARGKGGDFEKLEIGPLVKELEKMVRETFPKNITVESFLPPDLWPVRANPTQLHQVLLNLCVNARDAMPEGGRLSFAADNVELDDATAAKIPGAVAGSYLTLLVSDTGTGMPLEVRARIFEPFFTTKGEGVGTGIGLATVLRIVKSHGGFLSVESEPGQGTTFEVFLPRALPSPAAVSPAPSATGLSPGNGELILVVDDEKAVRELVADGLELHGYRALTAANGEEAVQLFQRHEAEVRLLFTDSSMPVMDGLRATALMREICPSLPVILATGEAPPSLERVHVLQKPFSLDEIIRAVQRALQQE